MEKKSQLFFIFLFLLIFWAVSASYYRYVVKQDYVIETEMDCDPSLEVCFMRICDPEIDGECTGDLEEDTSYYKIVRRNAKNIPLCDTNDERCQMFVCPEREEECEILLCDERTVEEGATCNNPTQYVTGHPIEENAEETELEEEISEEENEEKNAGDLMVE